jgi:hypothetical protein
MNKIVDLPLLRNDCHYNPVVRSQISGKDGILFSIEFKGIVHITHKDTKSVSHAVQRCRAKAIRIKEANCSTCPQLLHPYSYK